MKHLIIVAISLIALTSCNKDYMDTTELTGGIPDDKVVRMDTRVAIGDNTATTENLSEFGLFIVNDANSDYSYNNVKIVKDVTTKEWQSVEHGATGWNPKSLYWENNDRSVAFIAYAPYNENATLPGSFSIARPSDQRIQADFIKSDVLYAESMVQPCSPNSSNMIYYNDQKKNVTFAFEHARTKLTFNITIKPTLLNTVPESPISNVLITEWTAGNDRTDNTTQPYQIYTPSESEDIASSVTYEAVIQSRRTKVNDRLKLSFSLAGKNYTWSSTPFLEGFEFITGKNYIIDGIIAGDGIVTGGAITATDWILGNGEDGENLETE